MIKIINVAGIKISQLIERGKLPGNLTWIGGSFPPSYSINFIHNNKKTIICCSDSFGGGIVWTTIDGIPNILGKERFLGSDEQMFLNKNYPELLEAINELDK